jgi:hypothetical protein
LLEKARVGHNVSTKNLSTVLFQPGGGVSSESRLLFSVAYFLEFTVHFLYFGDVDLILHL